MGYDYVNDYERECTQKYEGFYTSEEIELNKKLYEECSKDILDTAVIEDLLKSGADPLGGTAIYGWDILNHIYGELVMDSQNNKSINLPKITELFLKYGMDVEKPRIPYDGNNSCDPLWDYSFIANENAIVALKMLLDHGLSADAFAVFWDHSMFDYCNVECGDPQNDEFWNYDCTWTLKMMLLGASYDHILHNDKGLFEFLCCDINAYNINRFNIHLFRNWNNYEYYFDTSGCGDRPEMYGSIVHIYEKQTGEEVWRLGVGIKGRKILKERIRESIHLRLKVAKIASESDWSLDTEKKIARVMDNSDDLRKTVEELVSVLSPDMTDEEALEAIKTVK